MTMRFVIEDDVFSYSADWSKENKIEDGFVEEYHPSCQESLEAIMKLLTNIYSPENIIGCLERGIDSIDYLPNKEQKEDE